MSKTHRKRPVPFGSVLVVPIAFAQRFNKSVSMNRTALLDVEPDFEGRYILSSNIGTDPDWQFLHGVKYNAAGIPNGRGKVLGDWFEPTDYIWEEIIEDI